MNNEAYVQSGSGSDLDIANVEGPQNDQNEDSQKVTSKTDDQKTSSGNTTVASLKKFLKSPQGIFGSPKQASPTQEPSEIPKTSTTESQDGENDGEEKSENERKRSNFGGKSSDVASSNSTVTDSVQATAARLRDFVNSIKLSRQAENNAENSQETAGETSVARDTSTANEKTPGSSSRKFPKLPNVSQILRKYSTNHNSSSPSTDNVQDSTSDEEIKPVDGKNSGSNRWIQTMKRPLSSLKIKPKRDDEVDTSGMCGAFGRYPAFLQCFATPRFFLIAFCLQNILQGIASSLFIGTNTSLERHFHFSSKTIGSILMFSEIGPIFSSLFLSQLGGRGNRPRWMALGQLLSMSGLFIAFANNFFYPPPEPSELSGQTTFSLCDYRDLLTEEIIPLRSTASSLRSLPEEKCFDYNQSAYFSWLLAHTLIGVGNSLVYAIGAPYLDDSIKKKNSPMYFAIGFAVRILGPLVGFSLTAALLKVYVKPSVDPGIQSSDPRWIGAWWIGCLWLSLMFLICSLVTSLFPKIMRDNDILEDKERGKITSSISDSARASDIKEREDSKIATDFLEYEKNNGMEHNNAIEEMKDLPSTDSTIANENTSPEVDKKSMWQSLLRVAKNPVITFGLISDFFGMSAIFSIYMWLPKYHEHHFRVSKSVSSLATGITGASSLIIGILGGGMFVQRCRPSARTITTITIVCRLLYIISLAGLMHIDCGFNDDLPGVLSPDKQSIELYRGCSGGCECATKEFIPLCITDGPLQVTFFSPCHAGCYMPGEKENGTRVTPVTENGQIKDLAAVSNDDVYYHNCSCGSETAEVKSGYCKHTCPGFMYFNLIHITVNSFAAFGSIGSMLISLRAVSEEDKTVSLGYKSSIMSLAMLLNPVIFGSLFDSTCLLWEEACGETGACWVYDTIDSGFKMFTSAIILIIVAVIFELVVYHYVKDVKLFDEEIARNDSTSRTLSSTLSTVFGSKMSKSGSSGTNSESTNSGSPGGRIPSLLNQTFRRLSKSPSLVGNFFRSNGSDKDKPSGSDNPPEGDIADIKLPIEENSAQTTGSENLTKPTDQKSDENPDDSRENETFEKNVSSDETEVVVEISPRFSGSKMSEEDDSQTKYESNSEIDVRRGGEDSDEVENENNVKKTPVVWTIPS